jgi:CRP-like cAMP-binding protein
VIAIRTSSFPPGACKRRRFRVRRGGMGKGGAGEFFGEGCLAGQPVRMATATAASESRILLVDKQRMVRLLHDKRALSDRFIAHMLARNIRIEEDLIDQRFNSSEKRLGSSTIGTASRSTTRCSPSSCTTDGVSVVVPRVSRAAVPRVFNRVQGPPGKGRSV